jgi:hypothetical protein
MHLAMNSAVGQSQRRSTMAFFPRAQRAADIQRARRSLQEVVPSNRLQIPTQRSAQIQTFFRLCRSLRQTFFARAHKSNQFFPSSKCFSGEKPQCIKIESNCIQTNAIGAAPQRALFSLARIFFFSRLKNRRKNNKQQKKQQYRVVRHVNRSGNVNRGRPAVE